MAVLMPGSSASGNGWVGVDLGTHAVRVVVVSEDSSVLALASRPFARIRREGLIHEQDPEEWWSATVETVAVAVAEAGSVRLRGLSISGTSGTVLLVRATASDPAQPVTAGIMYNDLRATDEANRLMAEPSAESWLRTGFFPTATSGLAKADRLFREYAAAHGARTEPSVRLAQQVDIIASRLCGVPVASDTSHAMKSGVDLFTGQWPMDDFARLGIPGEFFSGVAAPGSVIGEVSSAAAELTGLPAGMPVVAGMSDGCAGQIASGVLTPGEWAAVLGTTTVIKGVSDKLIPDPLHSLYHHRPPGSNWWPGGASATGSGLITSLFGGEELDSLRAGTDLGVPASVVSYPLQGSGERFPFLEPRASGFSSGAPVDRTDYYASLMQGMALVIRLCLERVELLGGEVIGPLALVGGVTRSTQFVQLLSDVLDRPVRVPQAAEGAVGMAVLASSIESDLPTAASRMLGPSRIVDPGHGRGAAFERPYELLLDELASRGWMDHRSPQRVSEAE